MSVFAKQTSRFVKLKNVGDSVRGTLTEISEPRQSTKYDPRPGAPRVPDFYESSDGGAPRPKMEVILTLQTTLNEGPDETGNPDDGLRKLVVPVFYKEGSMLSVMQDAMARAGARDLEIGADLGWRHTGHDPQSANPQNPRKLYEAFYNRPAGGGGVFQAGAGQQQQQQQAPQHQAAPATQHPAAQQYQGAPIAQQAAAPAAQVYQPPVAVNTSTGEVGGPAAAPSWGGQTAAGAPVNEFPPSGDRPQAWSAPAEAYVPPANPTPQQAQAATHFPAAQAAAWQPPAAAAAPAPAPQVDAQAIRNLINQGAPDGYIYENVPGATPEAVAAIRNAPSF